MDTEYHLLVLDVTPEF